MADNTGHTEQDLLEQWTFLDTMVERQASQLRAGIQDEEEAELASDSTPTAELATLRAKVAEFEQRCQSLTTDVANLTTEAQRHQQVVARMQGEVQARDATIATLRAHAAEVQAAAAHDMIVEMAKRDALIAGLTQQREEMNQALAAADNHLVLLRTQLAATQDATAAKLSPPPSVATATAPPAIAPEPDPIQAAPPQLPSGAVRQPEPVESAPTPAHSPAPSPVPSHTPPATPPNPLPEAPPPRPWWRRR